MADAPRFALYVSSVPGRLVSRPGSPYDYLGAQRRTPDEIKAGITEPTWQPDVVIPILESEYNNPRFRRDWDGLIREGDLKARTEGEFKAYQAELAKVESARDAELAKAAKASKAKDAEARAPEAEGSKGAGGAGGGS